MAATTLGSLLRRRGETILEVNIMAAFVLADVEAAYDAAQTEYRERSVGVIEASGGGLMGQGNVAESTAGGLTSRRRMLALELPTLEQARARRKLHQASTEPTGSPMVVIQIRCQAVMTGMTAIGLTGRSEFNRCTSGFWPVPGARSGER